MSRRSSGRSSSNFVSSYMKPRTQPPGGVIFAFSASTSWTAEMRRRLTLTASASHGRIGWLCASMNPGVTVMPRASMRWVLALARLSMSSFDPTARMRLPRTAIASTTGLSGFMVSTRPPVTIMLALPVGGRPCAPAAVASPTPSGNAAEDPRKRRLLSLLMLLPFRCPSTCGRRIIRGQGYFGVRVKIPANIFTLTPKYP